MFCYITLFCGAHVHDRWKWLLDPIQGYSMRGAYHFLVSADAPLDWEHIDDVWHKSYSLEGFLVRVAPSSQLSSYQR